MRSWFCQHQPTRTARTPTPEMLLPLPPHHLATAISHHTKGRHNFPHLQFVVEGSENVGGGGGKFKYCFVSGTGKTVTLWICMIMEQIVASVLQTEFVVKFTLRPGVLLHSGGWERWCLMMGPRFHPAAPNCLRWWWQWPRLGLNRPQNVWALWFQTLVLTSLGKLSRQKWGREEI